MNARDWTLLEWSDAYSVGNPLLDSQHKRILAMCRTVQILIDDASDEGLESFHELLHQMREYAGVHFETEEALLRQCAYPQLNEQRAEHLKYLEDLSDILFDAVMGNIDKPLVKRFLTGWWLTHILGSDMAYKDYLSRAGLG